MLRRRNFDLTAAMAATDVREQVATELTLAELAHAFQASRCDDSDTRIRKWLKPFGSRSAWSIQTTELKHAAEAMARSGYQQSTLNRDLSLLGSIYIWAIDRRLCPPGFQSPTRAIPRGPERIRRVEVPQEALRALLAHARATPDRRFSAFVQLLLDTGARKSEVLRRCWQDIDLEARTILCETTKTGTPRVLHFQSETAELITRVWPKTRPADRLIFEGRRGTGSIDFRRQWKSLTAAVNLEWLRIHDLRHVVAAQLLRADVSVEVASQTLGNSSQILSRRYGHLGVADMRAAQQRRWGATR